MQKFNTPKEFGQFQALVKIVTARPVTCAQRADDQELQLPCKTMLLLPLQLSDHTCLPFSSAR
jgi:hypothetical protein